ncbi:MAG: Protein-export membrane protein SecG [Microgenomates group bacterium GW2011_GWC2_45_8]|nr:MAG: Protein-export membrane protein SecG [Microgenomates group bacterium GW2011_GWC2_45_8]KKU25899.1 MAG: Protein-export membrane protein SecG [Microgenomates group bacterium GW2011_GWA2_46_16]
MLVSILQIITALVLITVIILQSKGTGLGAGFGASSNYHTKRGVEKSLFYVTLGVSLLFICLAIRSAL